MTGTSPQASADGTRPADPIRVAMVVHAYYEGDARVRRYAESLASRGHEVEVFALRRPGLSKREDLCGVRVSRLPLSRKRGGFVRYFLEYLWFALLAALVLTKRTVWKGDRRRRGFDIVHVHNMPDFLVFTALVPRLFGARTVLDVHDLMPEVYASKFKTSMRHPGILLMRVQEWISHRFASRVVFATEQFRRCALARHTCQEKHSAVVMNAADTKVFDRSAHPWTGPDDVDAFTILYLGTVSHRHGVDQCVKVLPLLRERIPGARLILHPRLAEAEGKPLEEVARLAAELGVEDMLDIRAPLALTDVPAVMAKTSVGVFTPHLDVHIDMALSLKVPEFVAMGVPVVAVRTSIMESLFEEGEVLLFEDGDTAAFAEHLLFLREHPEEALAMTRRAERFTSQRSWENEFDSYAQCLRELTGKPVHPSSGEA